VTDNPFIISSRITFEVSVRLLGGLIVLGYTLAATLKRSSHVFFDGEDTVKIDWLEQLIYRLGPSLLFHRCSFVDMICFMYDLGTHLDKPSHYSL
jgi:hypothetical protein